MNRRKKVIACVAAVAVVVACVGLAQGTKDKTGSSAVSQAAQPIPNLADTTAKEAAAGGASVRMWCNVADNAHTIHILASNSSSTPQRCSAVCLWRKIKSGNNGRLECSGFMVHGNANQEVVCYSNEPNDTFLVTNIGTHTCP